MPTYAYRWADGSVSVCGVKNRDEAAAHFDNIAPISRKLIVRIKSPLVLTLRPDVDSGWVLDEEHPLDGKIDWELEGKCFPRYHKASMSAMHQLEKKRESLDEHSDLRKKIDGAIRRDMNETRKRIRRTPQTPDIVVLYPKGLPGQRN